MAPATPALSQLASVFGRIGNLTFGGGGATVAALQREIVSRLRWLDEEQFALCYALARVTPGTNLLAFCTAAGWLLRGMPGAIATVLVASIPSCLLVWAVTAGFDAISRRPLVQVAVNGALAASVGILLASFWLIIRAYVSRANWRRPAAIVLASIVLSLWAQWPPVAVLAAAAVAGWFQKA